jgi:hypothetical protein
MSSLVASNDDASPAWGARFIADCMTNYRISVKQKATLDGWVMGVGELLHPITVAMGQELLSGTYTQADETTVGCKCTMAEGKWGCPNKASKTLRERVNFHDPSKLRARTGKEHRHGSWEMSTLLTPSTLHAHA